MVPCYQVDNMHLHGFGRLGHSLFIWYHSSHRMITVDISSYFLHSDYPPLNLFLFDSLSLCGVEKKSSFLKESGHEKQDFFLR